MAAARLTPVDQQEPRGRRVTVGVPVRNGAATLRDMLAAIERQTHRELQVIVADNASTDGTSDVVREFAERDPRFRLLRHDQPLTMIQNWRSVYEACATPYFMWAADDDVISDDYVAGLLSALEAHPDAGLAFGEVVRSQGLDDSYLNKPPYDYRCATRGQSVLRRLLADKNGGFAIYGLFRREVLEAYGWHEHSLSPDWPLMIHVLVRTDIVQVSGPMLYYRFDRPKGAEERAQRQSYRSMESFPTARLSWSCGVASRSAAAARGARRSAVLDAAVVFLGILYMNRGTILQRLRARLLSAR
jgi:glycosyltransferase involved in cell wall biosynthesis